MPLTTYTAGQVLTASSLNANLSFAASAGGFSLVKTQTIGSAVGSVTVTGAFSSTYDNYLITLNGGVGSGANDINMTLGATATGYYSAGYFVVSSSTTVGGTSSNNGSSWLSVGGTTTNTLNMEVTLYEPNLAKRTVFNSRMIKASGSGPMVQLQGYLDNATQYTDFTLTASAGTLTGGTIRIYGYANS